MVGEKENNTDSVNVRMRSSVMHIVFKVDEVIGRFEKLKRRESPENDEFLKI